MPKEYDNTNTGIMFRNEGKDEDNPNWPDFKGSIDIEGDEYWLSAWVKEGQRGKLEGKKFFSISFQPKESRGRGSSCGGGRGRDRYNPRDGGGKERRRKDDDRAYDGGKSDGGDDIPF